MWCCRTIRVHSFPAICVEQPNRPFSLIGFKNKISFFILPIASCASICAHTECFNSPGSLSSPNYPNNYWNYVKMSWLITSPKGQVITISFDSRFGTYSTCQPSCECSDYVGIYDGTSTSDTQIGKYCGTTGPGNITSSSNGNLLVTFTSDASGASLGFSATFYFEGKYTVVTS